MKETEYMVRHDEKDRVKELDSYSMFDQLPLEEFDNLTKLAAQIAEAPVSLINLMGKDKQWTKSWAGPELGFKVLPRKRTICQYTIKKQGNDRNYRYFKRFPLLGL